MTSKKRDFVTARILDGTKIRDSVFADLAGEIQRLGARQYGRVLRPYWWAKIRLRSFM